MNFYERALELSEETVAHRRWLHSNVEVGREGGRTILLRADMDALSGRVRFMFQPAEETFEGAKDMPANGILEGWMRP